MLLQVVDGERQQAAACAGAVSDDVDQRCVRQLPYGFAWRTADAITDDDAPFDYLLVLFASIFQMRDWIAASRPDLKSDIEALFKASANVKLTRDLANGSKHMTLNSYDEDRSASVARKYSGSGRIRYVAPRPVGNGGNLEALPLADRRIEELRAYMQQHGPLQ